MVHRSYNVVWSYGQTVACGTLSSWSWRCRLGDAVMMAVLFSVSVNTSADSVHIIPVHLRFDRWGHTLHTDTSLDLGKVLRYTVWPVQHAFVSCWVVSYYIYLGMSYFTAYLWKQTTQVFLANFYFCFAVALKGLVSKLAVEHQIRYTKRVDLPTDVAVQVVSLVLGGVVYPW